LTYYQLLFIAAFFAEETGFGAFHKIHKNKQEVAADTGVICGNRHDTGTMFL